MMKRGTEKQDERLSIHRLYSEAASSLLQVSTPDMTPVYELTADVTHSYDYSIIVVCNHGMVRNTVNRTVMLNIGRIPTCTTGQCFQIQKQGRTMGSTHGLLHTTLVSIKGHPQFMSNRFTVSGRSSFTHKLEDPHNTIQYKMDGQNISSISDG